jgi:hypothetical protein
LAPGITAVSESLVKVINKMVDSGVADELLIKLGHGIDWISKEVGSDETKNHIRDFLKAIVFTEKEISKIISSTSDVYSMLFNKGEGVEALHAVPNPEIGQVFPQHDYEKLGGGNGQTFMENRGSVYKGPRTQNPVTELYPDSAVHAVPAKGSADDDSFLDDRSKREMSGVNAPLAKSLIEAANASGIKFRVLQGRRTAEEAAGNAANGTGVADSNHIYGAAADIRLIDPNTGKESRDPALYRKFAQSFDAASQANGQPNQRWLGASGDKWSWDIAHFDQGMYYGKNHAPDPYGHASAPTPDDIKAARTEEYESSDNVFLRRQSTASGQNKTVIGSHPNESRTKDDAVKIIDNTGGSILISVPH